ncbi:unnamed protein product [Lactuca virosa]|uniref:Uncharacterized protein n=1 Tax=Lactuca virosa TaxID=75947 RepID=A0AAU9NXY6_9ASTR|nr:unnamed protein product [Lactuca virosa]
MVQSRKTHGALVGSINPHQDSLLGTKKFTESRTLQLTTPNQARTHTQPLPPSLPNVFCFIIHTVHSTTNSVSFN